MDGEGDGKAPVFFSADDKKEPEEGTSLDAPSLEEVLEEVDVDWDDDMDGGKVVAVNYLEFESVQQSLYDRVKAAVIKHQVFLNAVSVILVICMFALLA